MQDLRRGRRGPGDRLNDPLYAAARGLGARFGSVYAALGAYLVTGTAIVLLGTWSFAWLAVRVRGGRTQRVDEAALLWLGEQRGPAMDVAMVEITALGTGLVVVTVCTIAAVLLALGGNRASALLLMFAVIGGIALNNVLKLTFARPRPLVIEWGTQVHTSSFPSGHAMSAVVAYGTLAWLLARLSSRPWVRIAIWIVGVLVIALIGLSRTYLGVHYPSDVIAGAVVGTAWVAFCASLLEVRRVILRARSDRREAGVVESGS